MGRISASYVPGTLWLYVVYCCRQVGVQTFQVCGRNATFWTQWGRVGATVFMGRVFIDGSRIEVCRESIRKNINLSRFVFERKKTSACRRRPILAHGGRHHLHRPEAVCCAKERDAPSRRNCPGRHRSNVRVSGFFPRLICTQQQRVWLSVDDRTTRRRCC